MRSVVALLLALCVLAPGICPAQKILSSSELRELEVKVENQLNSYWRLHLAEQEAEADRSPERVAHFREAKRKAYETYMELNVQLKKAQLDRREYLKRQDQDRETYR